MRFSIPAPNGRLFELHKQSSERSFTTRLAFIILPSGVLLCLFAGWLGFQAASSTLEEALPIVPMLEAKHQAEKIEIILERLHAGLIHIAKLPDINPQQLRAKLPEYFHEYAPFIAEFCFKTKDDNGFLLLRDKDEHFVPVNLSFASQGAYAPFAQMNTRPPRQGEATLFPAVRTGYSGATAPDQTVQTPIIRMALPLDNNRGVLAVGLDLERLHALLAVYVQADSPLRTPMQEGSLQLAYFFEPTGWMLFEMRGQGEEGGLFPDVARRGYEGDLGRPGFDAAFRPWAAHENYWRMVTDIAAGNAGYLPSSTRHFSLPHTTLPASLCYAPVMFAPRPGAPAQIIGGIAFLETSRLPVTAFFRAVNNATVILITALVILGLLVFTAGRKLAVPMRRIAEQLQGMLHTGSLVPLEARPSCEEQQALLEAGNELITRNLALQADLDRMQLEMQQARSVLPVDLDDVLTGHDRHENFGLVGSSSLMQKVREEVRKAGQSGADVLVWGETGTGKELVAAAIHQTGVSTEGPFISINCGALDENLLLDTLFGHVKGAFTEAKSDRKGAFLSAEGGTLFLDEIATASLKVQQSLLRALSMRRIRPLGSDMEIPFTTRLVAATNADLLEKVRRGQFREDLYYRLAIINIATPALRRRKEDIPELAAHFIREAGKKLTRTTVRLSRGALEAMMEHSWPGNVRELKNCVTRAMAFMEGDLILRRHILIDSEAPAEDLRQSVDFTENEAPLPTEKTDFDYAWEYLWPPAARPEEPDAAPALPPVFAVPPAGANPQAPNITALQPVQPRRSRPSVPAFISFSRSLQPPPQSEPPRPSGTVSPLNERQMLALQHIRMHGGITRMEYETLAGGNISARTMQNDLRGLVELGVLKRVGGGPKTRYLLSRRP